MSEHRFPADDREDEPPDPFQEDDDEDGPEEPETALDPDATPS